MIKPDSERISVNLAPDWRRVDKGTLVNVWINSRPDPQGWMSSEFVCLTTDETLKLIADLHGAILQLAQQADPE